MRIAGVPKMAIRSQGSAAPAISPLPARAPAITETRGTAAICTTRMVNSPSATANQVACTPSATAATRSPAP